MSLESGTYINDLVTTNPAGTDPKSQGDDHLRLVKSTLKNTFPQASGPIKINKDVSILGDGTKVTIGTATEDALQIDATAKLIKAVAPYSFSAAPGEIIQQRMFSDEGSKNLPPTLGNITQSPKLFTPKSTNSTIVCSVSFYGYSNSSGSFINVQIKESGVIFSTLNSAGISPSGIGQVSSSGIIESFALNDSLAQRSFQLWANNATGQANGACTNLIFTITEIQN